MKELSGPISDRLRDQLKPDDPAWHPTRHPEPARPVPPATDGHPVGRGPDRHS